MTLLSIETTDWREWAAGVVFAVGFYAMRQLIIYVKDIRDEMIKMNTHVALHDEKINSHDGQLADHENRLRAVEQNRQ